MPNLLIPTDFTPASLTLAEEALRHCHTDPCDLILFHAFRPLSSPEDLLGSRYRDPSAELMTEPFRQACRQLKEAYPQKIGKILVRCLTGDTRSVFLNFVDAHDIDLIYCPESYQFRPAHERSLDPCFMFEKCGIPVIRNIRRERKPQFESEYYSNWPLSTQ